MKEGTPTFLVLGVAMSANCLTSEVGTAKGLSLPLSLHCPHDNHTRPTPQMLKPPHLGASAVASVVGVALGSSFLSGTISRTGG
jgi:hypothetical protein